MNLEAIKQRARTWWAGLQDKTGLLILLVGAVLAVLILSAPREPATPAEPDVADLARRVDSLERSAAQGPADQPAPLPDPQPPRASAPRAALRPSQPVTPAVPTSAAPIYGPEEQQWQHQSIDQFRASLRPNQPQE